MKGDSMDKDFVLTQTRTVTMTKEKTVTETAERLETIDFLGNRKTVAKNKSSFVKFHDDRFRRVG